jgi:hypothetical protein
MTQTLTLTTATVEAARVALLNIAYAQADKTLDYVARGFSESAAYAAERSFQAARAWHEMAHASK